MREPCGQSACLRPGTGVQTPWRPRFDPSQFEQDPGKEENDAGEEEKEREHRNIHGPVFRADGRGPSGRYRRRSDPTSLCVERRDRNTPTSIAAVMRSHA